MELLQLYYFQVTARHEHMTEAAKELHIAQPALSQTIKSLETELGTPLFDRHGKHIRLNQYGHVFLKYANTALNAVNDGKAQLHDMLWDTPPEIRLSVQAASWLLPDILEKFSAIHPEIRFQIFQSLGVHDHSKDIDLTIEAALNPPENEHSCVLLKEPLLAALPANHPLSALSSIELRQLASLPFASLHPDSNLCRIVKHYCSQAGFEPEISLSCDNPQTFRELLHLNKGTALLPALTWPDMQSSHIVTLPVSKPECSRYILLSWNPGRYLNSSAELLKHFLTDYFSKLARTCPER